MNSIEVAGYKPGSEVQLALDVAATELYRDGAYQLSGEGRSLSSDAMVAYLDRSPATTRFSRRRRAGRDDYKAGGRSPNSRRARATGRR